MRQTEQKTQSGKAGDTTGAFAVQIAKSFAAEVTGVCSARNAGMVKAIGADHVIDYKSEDYIDAGQCYDLIIDRLYPLSEVPAAITYSEEGHARGKIVISLD